MIAAQEKIGAFGNAYKKSNQPKLSPKAKEKIQKQMQKEQDDFNSYVKEREGRGKKLVGKPM